MNEFGKNTLTGLLADDPEMEFRIKTNTELYRKGFGDIKLKYSDGSPVTKAEIRINQTEHEFQFGANAFMLGEFPTEEENRQYEELFAGLFNTAVLPFYWKDLEPVDGQVRFRKNSPKIYRRPAPETGLEFCEKYNLTPKGHPLCWHDYWPDWVDKDPRKAMGRLERRFQEIAEFTAKRIPIWDVMNEAQTRDFLCKTHMPRFPRNYIEEIFQMAERYFPEATLCYNDDCRWWCHQAEYSPVYLLVEKLKRSHCRVDALGMQFHMFEHHFPELPRFFSPRHLYGCFDLYAELNLRLIISEISILGNDLYFGKGEGEVFQDIATEKLYRLWFSHPAMSSIVWWNIVNNTSCSCFEEKFEAGIIKRDFTPRRAYNTLKRLIKEEWHTALNIVYEQEKINKFHGFYGDYDLVIRTDKGCFDRKIKLSRDSYNIFEITLEGGQK